MLTHKWNDLPDQGSMQRFVAWFVAYKTDAIQYELLRSQRQKAGLGNPPTAFTTIASGSINAVLKNKVNYKKSELPVFIDKLKQAIKEQDEEVERAVIGRGKYQFCSSYQHLECDEQEWFLRMSVEQRKAHLKKVTDFIPSKLSCSCQLFTGERKSPYTISSESMSQESHQSEQSTSRGAYQSEQSTSRVAYQSEQSTSRGTYQSEQSTPKYRDISSYNQKNTTFSCLGFHEGTSSVSGIEAVLMDHQGVNCISTLDFDPLSCSTSHIRPVVSAECQGDQWRRKMFFETGAPTA